MRSSVQRVVVSATLQAALGSRSSCAALATTLNYEVMELAADTELRLTIFTAEPGSPSKEAINLLDSWAATPEHEAGHVGGRRRRRRIY
ncbi:MAG TPA: hypothetical protein VGL57_02480 [Solirubrobacteraceae bacterium]